MIKLKYKELSREEFKIFGFFIDMADPEGIKFGNEDFQFYRDLMQQNLGQARTASFSMCHLKKQESLVIKSSEYHNYCEEAIMPLDGDILMAFGPAVPDDIVPVEQFELFRIPKNTLVSINCGVWHHIPFTFKCDSVNILVVLPERTYKNDCHIIEIPEYKWIRVTEKLK